MSLLNGVSTVKNEEAFMEEALKEDCKKQGRDCKTNCDKFHCAYHPNHKKPTEEDKIWDPDA